jgi:glutathione-specific gamma-glutamylcyclotransferase
MHEIDSADGDDDLKNAINGGSKLPPDAFAHHPELHDRIADPLTSYFRTFSVEKILKQNPQLAGDLDWVRSDEDRERTRAETLTQQSGDLWIYAYGSLMWDPGFNFSDVRRAHVPDYVRAFILLENRGGRGTKEVPGLMAALDTGQGCEGLAFRIAAPDVDTETEILWRREMLGHSFVPTFINAVIDGQPQRCLTFAANHAAESIVPDILRADQVRYIATGKGFLGTSKAYLENIVSHFALLGIADEDCTDLLREVEDFLMQ